MGVYDLPFFNHILKEKSLLKLKMVKVKTVKMGVSNLAFSIKFASKIVTQNEDCKGENRKQ